MSVGYRVLHSRHGLARLRAVRANDPGKVSIRPRGLQPWRHRDLAHGMVFLVLMVWVGGEEGLVVKTEANVEESIGAGEGDFVDRSCFEVRCWRGSTAEAIRLVPVDRVKDRSAEQIVNIPAPRIMEEILADLQVAPHERPIVEQAVEGVKGDAQERIWDRIASSSTNSPWSDASPSKSSMASASGLTEIVEVTRMAPRERGVQ